jgi:hypothetical protein
MVGSLHGRAPGTNNRKSSSAATYISQWLPPFSLPVIAVMFFLPVIHRSIDSSLFATVGQPSQELGRTLWDTTHPSLLP